MVFIQTGKCSYQSTVQNKQTTEITKENGSSYGKARTSVFGGHKVMRLFTLFRLKVLKPATEHCPMVTKWVQKFYKWTFS